MGPYTSSITLPTWDCTPIRPHCRIFEEKKILVRKGYGALGGDIPDEVICQIATPAAPYPFRMPILRCTNKQKHPWAQRPGVKVGVSWLGNQNLWHQDPSLTTEFH